MKEERPAAPKFFKVVAGAGFEINVFWFLPGRRVFDHGRRFNYSSSLQTVILTRN
jgi:hypothetical protein